MEIRLPESARAATLFSFEQIGYFISQLMEGLALGPTGRLAFLVRPVHLRLTRAINEIEPLLRRVLYLMAYELGAMPAPSAPARRAPKPVSTHKAPTSASPVRHPRFRLSDPAGRPGNTPPPPPVLKGPRIRFLDEATAHPLSAYPKRPTDMLPAAALIRRLHAVIDVLNRPAHYLTAMRARLDDPKTINPTTSPALRSPTGFAPHTLYTVYNAVNIAILPDNTS